MRRLEVRGMDVLALSDVWRSRMHTLDTRAPKFSRFSPDANNYWATARHPVAPSAPRRTYNARLLNWRPARGPIQDDS